MQNFGFKDAIARLDEPYRNFGSTDLSNVGEDILNVVSNISPIDEKEAVLETEAQEILLRPDGRMFVVLGKPHSKGGSPLNVPADSFIFSKFKPLAIDKESKELFKMKEGGKWTKDKNTPAKLLQREVDIKHHNKMLSMLDSDNHDNISKNSAKLMLEKNFEKVGQVAYLQEEVKNFPNGLPNFAQGTAPQEENTEVMQSKQFMQLGGSNNPRGYGTNQLKGNNRNEYNDQSNAVTNDGYYKNGVFYPKSLSEKIYGQNWKSGQIVKDTKDSFSVKLPDGNVVDLRKTSNNYDGYNGNRIYGELKARNSVQGSAPTEAPKDQRSADGQNKDYLLNNDQRQFQIQGINNPTNTYKIRPKYNNLVAPVGVGNNSGNFTPNKAVPQQRNPVNRTNTPQIRTKVPERTIVPKAPFDYTAPKPFDDPNAVAPTEPTIVIPGFNPPPQVPITPQKPWEYPDEINPYTPELYKTFNQKTDEAYAAYNAINTPNFYPVRKQYNFTPLNFERISERPYLNQASQQTSAFLQNNRLSAPNMNRANASMLQGRALDNSNNIQGQVYNQNIQIGNQEAQYNNQGFNTAAGRNVDVNAQYVDQVNMTDQNAVIEDKMGWNAFTSLRNRNNDLIEKTKMTMASQPTYGTIWERNGQPLPPALKGKTDEELYKLGYRKTASPLLKLNPRTWNPEYTGAGNINLLGQQGGQGEYSTIINEMMQKWRNGQLTKEQAYVLKSALTSKTFNQ